MVVLTAEGWFTVYGCINYEKGGFIIYSCIDIKMGGFNAYGCINSIMVVYCLQRNKVDCWDIQRMPSSTSHRSKKCTFTAFIAARGF